MYSINALNLKLKKKIINFAKSSKQFTTTIFTRVNNTLFINSVNCHKRIRKTNNFKVERKREVKTSLALDALTSTNISFRNDRTNEKTLNKILLSTIER